MIRGRTAKVFVGLGSATVVAAALGMVRTKAVTFTLTPADYGALSLLMSAFGTFHVLGNLGLGTGMRRQAALHPEQSREILGSAAAVSLVVGVGLTTVGLVVARLTGVSILDHPDGRLLLALAALAVPLALLDGLWLDALYAAGDARLAGTYLVLARGWSVLCMAMLSWRFGILGAAAGFAVGFLPSAAWGFRSRRLEAGLRWVPATVRVLLRDGGLNQSIVVTNSLTTVAVRFLVLHAAGSTRLGLLAVAFALAGQLTTFTGAGIAGTIFNDYAAAPASQRAAVLRNGARVVGAVAGGMAAVGWAAAPTVVPLLTSAAYTGAVPAGRLALAGAAVESVFYVYGNAMFLDGLMARYLLVQNLGNVVFLAGAVAFRHDIEAVVVAYAVGQLASLALAVAFLRSHHRQAAPPLPAVPPSLTVDAS